MGKSFFRMLEVWLLHVSLLHVYSKSVWCCLSTGAHVWGIWYVTEYEGVRIFIPSFRFSHLLSSALLSLWLCLFLQAIQIGSENFSPYVVIWWIHALLHSIMGWETINTWNQCNFRIWIWGNARDCLWYWFLRWTELLESANDPFLEDCKSSKLSNLKRNMTRKNSLYAWFWSLFSWSNCKLNLALIFTLATYKA